MSAIEDLLRIQKKNEHDNMKALKNTALLKRGRTVYIASILNWMEKEDRLETCSRMSYGLAAKLVFLYRNYRVSEIKGSDGHTSVFDYVGAGNFSISEDNNLRPLKKRRSKRMKLH